MHFRFSLVLPVVRRALGALAGLMVLVAGAGPRAQAQGTTSYVLLAVSGDVQMGTGGQWRRANTGMRLQANDQLRLGERSYAAVVVGGARTLELKNPGVVTMSQLSASIRSASSSVTSKYLDYVVNRSTSNRLGNNMSNLGAVERSGMSPMPLSPPKNTALDDASATFSWRRLAGVKSYVFTLADDEGTELHKVTTEDTTVTLDLAALNLKPGVEYAWKVANARMAGMPSDEIVFNLMPEAKRSEVQQGARDIESELGAEGPAVAALTLAAYYAEQGLNHKAMAQYERAIAQAPAVREYRLMYAEFLSGLGMGSYAQQVLQAGGIAPRAGAAKGATPDGR